MINIRQFMPLNFNWKRELSSDEIKLIGVIGWHLARYLPTRLVTSEQKLIFKEFYHPIQFVESDEFFEKVNFLANKKRLKFSKYNGYTPNSNLAIALEFISEYRKQYSRFWSNVPHINIKISDEDKAYVEYTLGLLRVPLPELNRYILTNM